MKCPNCGNEIINGNPNCPNCGFPLNNLLNNNNMQNNANTGTGLSFEANGNLQNQNNINSNNSNIPFQANNIVHPQMYNNQVNMMPENNNAQQFNYQQNSSQTLYQNAVNNEQMNQQQYNNFNQNNFTNGENNINQGTNKKNNVFIFVVIGLVIIIAILVILVLNKNGVFNSLGSNTSNNANANTNNQNINNQTNNDNTILINGFRVAMPANLYYRLSEDGDCYQFSDKETFIYDYMVVYDELDYYINDLSELTDMFNSYNINVEKNEIVQNKGTRILLLSLDYTSSEITNTYYYIAEVSDYVVSCGFIYGYGENDLNNILGYISSMNSSIKTYNSLSANDSNNKGIKNIKVNPTNIDDFD